MHVLIVDDEPLARERIRSLLCADPEVSRVSECGNGPDALRAIAENAPDLLFLDVQMPELDGFALLEALLPDRLPPVIFVTAYERYALRAFEVHAVDYLLKPFDLQRFAAALARAKQRLAAGDTAELVAQVRDLLAEMRGRARHAEQIAVKSGDRVLAVRVDDIDYVQAAGNYVRLRIGAHSHLHRETLQSLEARLDPRRFRRIHRSVVVNVARIRELRPGFGKDYRVLLADGTELTLSRRFRDRLPELLS